MGHTTDELRRLLDLADELLDSYETEIRARRLASLAALLIVASAVVAIAALIREASAGAEQLILALLFVVVLAAGGAYARFAVLDPLRDGLRRDRRALDEVVHLLREVEGTIARDDRRTTLERAEFRIRLSRFDACGAVDRQ